MTPQLVSGIAQPRGMLFARIGPAAPLFQGKSPRDACARSFGPGTASTPIVAPVVLVVVLLSVAALALLVLAITATERQTPQPSENEETEAEKPLSPRGQQAHIQMVESWHAWPGLEL